MDFEFTDEQEELARSVERVLADHAPIGFVREHYDQPTGRGLAWDHLAALGVTGMLAGGPDGGGMVDLALPLSRLGVGLYPGPFTASAVGAVGLLAAVPDDPVAAEWLPRLADGTAVGAVVELDGPATGSTISTVSAPTLDAAAADLLLVIRDDHVIAVPTATPGVVVTPHPTVDGSRKFATVTFADVRGTPLGGDVTAAVRATRDRLAVAYVLDGIGAAGRALELAVEYAATREQFGRPIGSFQAVQHLAADMLQAVELGRAVGDYAAWACDAADAAERHRAATMAMAFATDACYQVTANAIQIFGGVGFTWEHDIHLFYKRTLTLQLAWGSRSDHLTELADLVLPPPR